MPKTEHTDNALSRFGTFICGWWEWNLVQPLWKTVSTKMAIYIPETQLFYSRYMSDKNAYIHTPKHI